MHLLYTHKYVLREREREREREINNVALENGKCASHVVHCSYIPATH